MTNDLHDLDNRLKKSAENFSLTPSPGVWENVDREINGSKRKKRAFLWFCVGAALLGGSGAWWLYTDPSSVQLAVEQGNPAPETTSMMQALVDTAPPRTTALSTDIQSNLVSTDDAPTPTITENLNRIPIAKKPETGDVYPVSELERKITGNVEDQIVTPVYALKNDEERKDTFDVLPAEPFPGIPDSLITEEKQDSPAPFVTGNKVDDTIIDCKLKGPGIQYNTWNFAVGVAPSISFTNVEEEGSTKGVSNYRNGSDKDKPSLNIHFDAGYSLLPRVHVYSGISVCTYREEIRSQQIVYRYDTAPVSGPSPPPPVVSEENYLIDNGAEYVTTNLTYIGISLGARFNVLPGNGFNIWLHPECAINRIARVRGYLYDDEMGIYRSMTKGDVQPWKFSYGLGFTLQRSLNANFDIELSPVYRIFAGSVCRSSNLLSQKFAQVELGLKLRYSFGK